MVAPPACEGSGNLLSFSRNLSCKASSAHHSCSGLIGWYSMSEAPTIQDRTVSSKTCLRFSVVSHYLGS